MRTVGVQHADDFATVLVERIVQSIEVALDVGLGTAERKDLFAEITLWDLRTKAVDVQPTGNGGYRVALHVEAQKLKDRVLLSCEAAAKRRPISRADPADAALRNRRARK